MAKPKDSPERKIGSRARQLVHGQINPDCWEYHEETGNDFGRDCVLELSENDEWNNHKIEGQIKGTTVIKKLGNNMISFPLAVSTIEYALGSPIAFVLFVVDVIEKKTYYQCIQKHFIQNVDLFDKLDQGTISIRIPMEQYLSNDDRLLQSWARNHYLRNVDGTLTELIGH